MSDWLRCRNGHVPWRGWPPLSRFIDKTVPSSHSASPMVRDGCPECGDPLRWRPLRPPRFIVRSALWFPPDPYYDPFGDLA